MWGRFGGHVFEFWGMVFGTLLTLLGDCWGYLGMLHSCLEVLMGQQTCLRSNENSPQHVVFLDNFGAKQLRSIAYITGPKRYRKVGDK